MKTRQGNAAGRSGQAGRLWTWGALTLLFWLGLVNVVYYFKLFTSPSKLARLQSLLGWLLP